MFCYIHIPFCEKKCKYCKFVSIWLSQKEKISKYINKLILDINNLNKKINRLESIYFWWWTPSVLQIFELELIIKTLKNKFWFKKDIEITLETTPKNISKEYLIWLKKLWINRLSIWVQTLNNKSLIEIWRGNKWDIIQSLNLIKNIWFKNISIDFIIWLPYVKIWEIKKDIEFIIKKYQFIKHISVYMLEDHYYPWNWKNISLDENDYLEEYIEVKNFLEVNWFRRYEISNFAKKWYECKHNMSYWNHSDVLAFWLWAHWFINKYRFSYFDKFEDFYKDKNFIEEKLDKNDIFLEKILFWLRTNWLKNNLQKKLDIKKVQEFIELWYLKIEDNILKLEDKWVLVLDYIIKEIV